MACTLFKALGSKIVPCLRVSTPENHTPFSGTYPSTPNEGVAPLPPPRVNMDQRNATDVESDVWQTQTADLQTGRSRGKHCCEILQQIPYP